MPASWLGDENLILGDVAAELQIDMRDGQADDGVDAHGGESEDDFDSSDRDEDEND
jgi:hypothetical protein